MAVRQCGYCQGRGQTIHGKCSVCNGKGWVEVPNNAIQCGNCQGRGQTIGQTIGGKCPVCHGTGWMGEGRINRA
jgi:DnaJ-class molecular chaperone